ncbi:MAG: FkbM family methyltransferase [Pseudomonadota bacterium]
MGILESRRTEFRRVLTSAVKSTARRLGYEVVRADTFDELVQRARIGRNIEGLLAVLKAFHGGQGYPAELIGNLHHSTSQFWQDIFVLAETNYRRNGYFVEFGAADGLSASNTYLLEKVFGWTGILAEPAKVWHEALRGNRASATHIETRCVWSRSGDVLPFDEFDYPELSMPSGRGDADVLRKERVATARYEVTTISLNDLLEEYRAPEVIDFLSIDTEGSEFDILNAFDFARHRFNVIVCEHNFSEQREPIAALLARHGYTRKHQDLSAVDDWYVRAP